MLSKNLPDSEPPLQNNDKVFYRFMIFYIIVSMEDIPFFKSSEDYNIVYKTNESCKWLFCQGKSRFHITQKKDYTLS